MSDRQTTSAGNPACRCGHALLRHVFGNGWCTVHEEGAGPCRCNAYDGPSPKPAPVDTVIVRGGDGLAALAYIPRRSVDSVD